MIIKHKTKGWRVTGTSPDHQTFTYKEFTAPKQWAFTFTAEGFEISVEALLVYEGGQYHAIDKATGLEMIPFSLRPRSEAALEMLEINQEYLNKLAKVFVPGEYYKGYKRQLAEYLERIHNEEHTD